ncbi:MAG: XRE family transcriptional regulator [Candidatus Cloacimonetes bacterium]|nr:XRE family transcriptional regulator [Candidatus Cloacimonadota bacterium]
MIGERFKKARKALRLKQSELGEELDVNASAICQYETNRIKPSIDTMILFAEKYGVNLHWLITGQGNMKDSMVTPGNKPAQNHLNQLKNMLNTQLREITQAKNAILNTDILDLEVTGEIAAGLPVESGETVLDMVTVRKSIIRGNLDDFICLRVNGHSMEPDIRHNDVVLIRQNQNWDKLAGKICAVRIDGAVTLKKLTLDAQKKMIVLMSLNEEYNPIIIRPEDHSDLTLIGYLYFLFRRLELG